jgi:drug/metabolite transporter (DMT)-like permease
MRKERQKGIRAALISAILLGFAPVFGRQAILQGMSPLEVVALRTALATALLLVIVLIFNRKFLYIYPVGLVGCLLAGVINGLGSVFYYMSLAYLPASLGQMLYSLYPFFLAIWLLLDRQPIGLITLLRIGLATVAVLLLINVTGEDVNMTGVLFMLVGSMLYALHLPFNQRVLYDVPAPTVTLYTLIAMTAVVVPAYFLFDHQSPHAAVLWGPIVGLTLVTFFSRLTLFLGVKHAGGMQTALLGLSELFVAIAFGHLLLGERLTWIQGLGAAILAASLLTVRNDPGAAHRPGDRGGLLSWIRPNDLPPNIPWGPHD